MKLHSTAAALLTLLAPLVGCSDSSPSSTSNTPASGVAENVKASDHPDAKIETTTTTKPAALSPSQFRSVVKLTDKAVAKLKEVLAAEPGKHVRLGVVAGGSSGFIYTFQIDEKLDDSDYVDDADGVRVVVDKKTAAFVDGMTIDWHTLPDGRAGFTFNNPNAKTRKKPFEE